ncbi:unnamed protein product, partial [Ectocarpus fasciculatus]
IPPIKSGKVVHAYDGDTFIIASKTSWEDSPLYRFKVRFRRIACPEIKNKTAATRCAHDREHNYYVKNKTRTKQCVKLARDHEIWPYVGCVNIGRSLLEKRRAVKCAGGKKRNPKDWMEYHYTAN